MYWDCSSNHDSIEPSLLAIMQNVNLRTCMWLSEILKSTLMLLYVTYFLLFSFSLIINKNIEINFYQEFYSSIFQCHVHCWDIHMVPNLLPDKCILIWTYHTSGYATLSNLDFKIIHCTGSNKKRRCLVNIIIIVINPFKT